MQNCEKIRYPAKNDTKFFAKAGIDEHPKIDKYTTLPTIQILRKI